MPVVIQTFFMKPTEHLSKKGRSEAESIDVAELKARARQGDLTLLATQLQAMRPQLLRIAARELRGQCPAGARRSDLVQKSFVLALEHIDQWNGTTLVRLGGWVRQILRNAVKQARRDARLTMPLLGDPESRGPSPSRLSAARQGYRQVVAEISQLPRARREALYLRLIEQRSLEEIALKLNQTQQVVASRIRHGLKQLRQRLEPLQTGRPIRSRAARLDAALVTYLRQCDFGQRPDRDAFLTLHADCAVALAPLIDWLQVLDAELAADAA